MIVCDFNCVFTPLSPPFTRGETRKIRFPPRMYWGGLGRGKKIFDTSIMTFQTSSYPLLIYFHPALTESTNLFPQLNSVAERAIANMQSLSLPCRAWEWLIRGSASSQNIESETQ